MFRRRPPREPQPPSIGGLLIGLLLIVFGVMPWLDAKYSAPRPQPSATTEPRRPPPEVGTTDPEALRVAIEAARSTRRRDPDSALQHIQDALDQAADPELRAKLLEWAAEIHYKRWHLHRAREAMQEAVDLSTNRVRLQLLADIEEQIRRNQGERGKASSYRAARDVGPAGTLTGRIVVAYLFVDPPGISRWSDAERQRSREVLGRVERWYQVQAEAHGVSPPEFVDRIFQVPLAAGDLPLYSDLPTTRRAAEILALNLGHRSLGSLLRSLVESEHADQVMFMVHSPSKGRSFTMYCARRNSCDEELSVLLEPTDGQRWDRVAYAVAHEGLHLFGADDLYDVRGAIDYSPTDIMNYPSAKLGYSEVGDLTAWAIGWRQAQPETDFTVEE